MLSLLCFSSDSGSESDADKDARERDEFADRLRKRDQEKTRNVVRPSGELFPNHTNNYNSNL